MIELRTFGRLDLGGPEGVAPAAVLAHPKRTALLVYLAAARPAGFQRRDTLVALLWPELDQDHARAALRKAVYHLRRSLGDDVVVGRGDEEISVARTRLWCDAAAFDEALERGDPAAAMELYRGHFLEGFFVHDALEFERWLDRERAERRERAFRAAWSMAEAAEQDGDAFGAAHWGRHAASLIPDDEAALRALIELLDRLGDRAGAVAAYEDFARRLAQDFDIEPAEETVHLIRAIRVRAAAPPEPAARSSPDEPPVSPPSEPVDVASGHARLAPRTGLRRFAGRTVLDRFTRVLRHRSRAAAVAVAALVIALAGRAVWQRSAPAAERSSATVAVLPFTVHGSDRFAYLGEGLVTLLGTNLNAVGELRSVDSRALLGFLARRTEPNEPLGTEVGQAVADRFGASMYILGDVVESGGRLRITAALYDRPSRRPLEEVMVEGDGEHLFDLVDELTGRLIAGRISGPGARLARIAALTTHSLPALNAYLEGERHSRAGRYDAAVEAFNRAVEADTSFAVAHHRLSNALVWTDRNEEARAAAAAAARHSERLTRRDRLLVEAWVSFQRGLAPEAERLYREVLALDPNDADAWYQLGDVIFHSGAVLGWPLAEAAEPFERVLPLQPENLAARLHLLRIAAWRDDLAAVDSLTAHLRSAGLAEAQALEVEVLAASARGNAAAAQELHAALASRPSPLLYQIAVAAAVYNRDLAGAARIAALLTEPAREPLWRTAGHLLSAQFEFAAGRLRTAREHLDVARPLHPAAAVEYEGVLATSPVREPIRAELEAVRRAVGATGEGTFIPGVTGRALARRPLKAQRQLLLLALLDARLGNVNSAARIAVRLASLPDTVGIRDWERAFGRRYARIVRAQLAWLGGRPADVLAELGPPDVEPDRQLPSGASFPEAHARFLRGLALEAMGRDADALRWFATFPDPAGYDLPLLVPAELHRAGILERQGDRAAALAIYARVADLWRDCDPELRPVVAGVIERVEELRREMPPAAGAQRPRAQTLARPGRLHASTSQK